jgi:anaerobic magnesium-protoporphyrin IX monomethyl ester cyclase
MEWFIMKNVKKYKYTFIYPDFEYRVYKAQKKGDPEVKVFSKGGWYNEGIAQLAAIIEEYGWEVDLIHMLHPYTKEELLAEIKKREPDVVGMNVRTDVFPYCEKIAGWLSGRGIYVMAGSYHASIYPGDVIKWKGLDSLVVGEGELPLIGFLKRWPKLGNYKIGGFWFKKKNGAVVRNNPTGVIEDFDKIPFPKFDIFDFDKLLSSKGYSAIAILTRGCPYRCTYCWNNFHAKLYPKGTKYLRFRSAANAIEYLKRLKKVYPQIQKFRFLDDILPIYKEWRDEFREKYLKELCLPFTCNFRANFLDDPTAKFLKDLGCQFVFFGVESGNEEILDKILKRSLNKKVVLRAFRYCQKYGIKTIAYNIVGIPYETPKKFLETIKFNALLHPSDVIPMIFCPYPATELTDMAIAAGFYDPKEERKRYVSVVMKDFTPKDVLFYATYFKEFVRLYSFALKLPEPLSKIFEKSVDTIYFSPLIPKKFLTGIRIQYKEKLRNRLYLFIKLHFPPLYRFGQRLQGK